jgi:hypothetical protein
VARWLSVNGADRTAPEVMHRTFETVDSVERLDPVFDRLSQQPDKTLLVTDSGRLVGLVGIEEVTNLLRFRRAAAGRRHHAAAAHP